MRLVVNVVKAKRICMIDPRRWNPVSNKMIDQFVLHKAGEVVFVEGSNGESITRTFNKRRIGVGYIPDVDRLMVVSRECYYTPIDSHEVRSGRYRVRTHGTSKRVPEHASMISLHCKVHGDTVDGIVAAESSVMHDILGDGIDIQ